MRNIDIM